MRSLLNNNKTKTNISSIGGGHLTAKPTKQLLTHKKHFIISIILVLTIVIGLPLGVHALVQNIFTDIGQITDISYAGDQIDQVVYQGTTIWERNRIMQEVTSTNCPTIRTRVNDARDNRSYYIQKLADGKCWMLTNLAYAGDGENTYNDVKSITNSETLSYTTPYFMIPPGSNPTNGTTSPSTTSTGQYGYLYNWCAAMGAQSGTATCANGVTPLPDQDISICPKGWRLPTGGTNGEYQALNTAINGGSTSSGAGLLAVWLGAFSGYWNNGFSNQGGNGRYWSSFLQGSTYAGDLLFGNSNVYPAHSYEKSYGHAVRCVAL